jgi:heat-inducible transcriptional repressor
MADDKINERRRQILRIVIQEFTKTAQPISSTAIAQNYGLGVSAATVRNDLAALESEGLLNHPHTSAGRIPTDAGYRFFVHHLLADDELPTDERRSIRRQFRQARQELDQWLRLSTSVLARASQSAALATAPRALYSRFKHAELVGIHGTKVLMVLVLQEGTVKQQLLDLDQPMEQDELSRISNELNARLTGATADGVVQQIATLTPFAQQIALLVADLMRRADSQQGRQIYHDGLVQVLEAPEFAEGDSVRRIVQVLEERTVLQQVVDHYSDAEADQGTIHVLIAGDGRFSALEHISLVIGRYGALDRASGLLGVVGPLRMSYGRNIGAVRFVAALMSEMVEELYGA